MSTIYGNALILPLKEGTSGFSVTFPATATNWNNIDASSCLLLADGTTKPIVDYSAISGQTIKNIIGINEYATSSFYVLKMSLSEGAIAQYAVGTQRPSYFVTAAPNTTKTLYASGMSTF